MPGGSENIYKFKGVKQVFIHGKEAKRVFTVVLSVNLGDEVLAIQSVWKKVLALSLPTFKASKEATKKRHQFGLNKYTY